MTVTRKFSLASGYLPAANLKTAVVAHPYFKNQKRNINAFEEESEKLIPVDEKEAQMRQSTAENPQPAKRWPRR